MLELHTKEELPRRKRKGVFLAEEKSFHGFMKEILSHRQTHKQKRFGMAGAHNIHVTVRKRPGFRWKRS